MGEGARERERVGERRGCFVRTANERQDTLIVAESVKLILCISGISSPKTRRHEVVIN